MRNNSRKQPIPTQSLFLANFLFLLPRSKSLWEEESELMLVLPVHAPEAKNWAVCLTYVTLLERNLFLILT